MNEAFAFFSRQLQIGLNACKIRSRPLSLGVCLSGGPDSLALLHMTRRWALERHTSLYAVHVNHGLRSEADAEAEWLEEQMQRLRVRFVMRKLLWPEHVRTGGAVNHAQVRERRHTALADMANSCNVAVLLMGHHADDVAETFVERIHMASGLAGLAVPVPFVSSLLPPNQNVSVVRPLLQFRKRDLLAVLGPEAKYVVDRYNKDSRFLRSRIREQLQADEGLNEAIMSLHLMVSREWKHIQERCDAMYESKLVRSDTARGTELKGPIAKLLRGPESRTCVGIAARHLLANALNNAKVGRAVRGSSIEHLCSWMHECVVVKQGPFYVWSEGGVVVEYRRKGDTFRFLAVAEDEDVKQKDGEKTVVAETKQ